MRHDEFVPLGVFEEQVLVAVLRTCGDAYGVELRCEIERVTGRELGKAPCMRRSIARRRRDY